METNRSTPSPALFAPAPVRVVEPEGVKGAGSTLALLFLVYLFNYLDRTLIYILFAPIKKELALSELQLALLGSTSFVLFYTTLGVPFGRLADKVSRTRMIAGGLALWSAASALTGAMHGFPGIFACRVLVGVGEATLGPAALSLLSDLFAPKRRATVNAAFSAGIPIGAGVALLVGGVLAARWGWRAAFYLCGVPGVVLAGLVMLLREPPRGASEQRAVASTEKASVALGHLARTPSFLVLVTGYAFYAVAANALSMWIPTFLVTVHGVPLARAGMLAGGIAASAGLVGVLAGGALSDRLRASGRGGRLRFSAIGALVSVPLWMLVLHSHSVVGALVPFAGLVALGLAWLGPAAADVQDLAGPERRGIAIGAYFFFVNAIGYGIGPLVIGKISDVLDVVHDASQRRVSLLVCPTAALVAAMLLFAAASRIERSASA